MNKLIKVSPYQPEGSQIVGEASFLGIGSISVGGACVDSSGIIYLSDSASHAIFSVNQAGNVSLFAGIPGSAGSNGGALKQARFNAPAGLAADRSGNIYVADSENHQIRVIRNNRVYNFAGSTKGFQDGNPSVAKLNRPTDVCVSRSGVVYVADTGNHSIRKIDGGVLTTLAGNGTSGDAIGLSTNSRFRGPLGITVDLSGRVYVADTGNRKIKVIVPDYGRVYHFTGSGLEGDALGSATESSFRELRQIWASNSNDLFVLSRAPDMGLGRVIRIDGNGRTYSVSRIDAGDMDIVNGLAISPDGTLYLSISDDVGLASSETSSGLLVELEEGETFEVTEPVGHLNVEFTGDDGGPSSFVEINGVSFEVKNVNNQLVWDVQGVNYTFTTIGESLACVANGLNFTVIFDGFGSLLFTVAFPDESSSSRSSIAAPVESSSGSSKSSSMSSEASSESSMSSESTGVPLDNSSSLNSSSSSRSLTPPPPTSSSSRSSIAAPVESSSGSSSSLSSSSGSSGSSSGSSSSLSSSSRSSIAAPVESSSGSSKSSSMSSGSTGVVEESSSSPAVPVGSSMSSGSSSLSSIGIVGDIAKFDFTSVPYLQVTSKNANLTVSNIVLSNGLTIETNITTGIYFPNEPYIEETGGWTAISQTTAKNFQFDITPDSGYEFTITNISFRAYATGTGPSAFSFDINSGAATYTVNAPDSVLVSVNQSVSGVRNVRGSARIKIQGWLNGSRASSGAGVFRLDDIVITGNVRPFVVFSQSSSSSVSSVSSLSSSSGSSIAAPVESSSSSGSSQSSSGSSKSSSMSSKSSSESSMSSESTGVPLDNSSSSRSSIAAPVESSSGSSKSSSMSSEASSESSMSSESTGVPLDNSSSSRSSIAAPVESSSGSSKSTNLSDNSSQSSSGSSESTQARSSSQSSGSSESTQAMSSSQSSGSSKSSSQSSESTKFSESSGSSVSSRSTSSPALADQSSGSSSGSSLSSQSSPPLPEFICVSGAGIEEINGTHQYLAGEDRYVSLTNPDYGFYKWAEDPYIIYWIGAETGVTDYYVSSTHGDKSPVGLTYISGNHGSGTMPTVVDGVCPDESSSGSSLSIS